MGAASLDLTTACAGHGDHDSLHILDILDTSGAAPVRPVYGVTRISQSNKKHNQKGMSLDPIRMHLPLRLCVFVVQTLAANGIYKTMTTRLGRNPQNQRV